MRRQTQKLSHNETFWKTTIPEIEENFNEEKPGNKNQNSTIVSLI